MHECFSTGTLMAAQLKKNIRKIWYNFLDFHGRLEYFHGELDGQLVTSLMLGQKMPIRGCQAGREKLRESIPCTKKFTVLGCGKKQGGFFKWHPYWKKSKLDAFKSIVVLKDFALDSAIVWVGHIS